MIQLNKGIALAQILTLLLFASCSGSDPNEQIDEGNVSDGIYTSPEIGWTINIPSGWTVVSRKKMDEMHSVGEQAIKDTLEDDINIEGLKYLISFQKNQVNIFQSTSQPFKNTYEGEWQETNKGVKGILLKTLRNQGLQVESTETRTEGIDGVSFQVFDIFISSPEGNHIAKLTMYASLINGFDFGANITYDNEAYGTAMLTALKNSKFTKILEATKNE